MNDIDDFSAVVKILLSVMNKDEESKFADLYSNNFSSMPESEKKDKEKAMTLCGIATMALFFSQLPEDERKDLERRVYGNR